MAAIRSADSPIVSPVEVSRIPGATGAMSDMRTSARLRTLPPVLFACVAPTSARASFGWIVSGTLVRLSAPPARTTPALPPAMWSAALVIATHAEAQAMPTVKAGMRGGRESESTISRARLWYATGRETFP